MIVSEEELKERIESPLNLMNRLKAITKQPVQIPSIPQIPKSEDIIDNLQEKISLGSVKSKAVDIMMTAMTELKARLPEVQKPERLASIAAEMSKVVSSPTQNKTEDNRTQVIIYSPRTRSEEDFEVINVLE